jgi:hypothetical protein
MYCLKNIEYARIPNDIIKLYLQIYPFIGRNTEMLNTVSRDFDVLSAQTIRTDAYFLAHMLNLTIAEGRYRQILTKDVQAKTKDEKLLRNIKYAFEKIHQETETFNFHITEVYDLLKFLYKDVEKDSQLTYAKSEKKKQGSINLLSSAHPTKREALEELIDTFKYIRNKSDFESSFVIVNFYVDFINLKPFSMHNDVIGLVMLYILLLSHGYRSLHLASVFEMLHKQHSQLDKFTKDASHNWSEGLADVMPLHRFMLKRLLESYKGLHDLLRNYTFDLQTNKSDYIENTINKLDEVFTKEEIRAQHPTISDSTINRTLKRLRDEKKIRPLGTGRSAKWMKLYQSQKKTSIYEQIKLKV